MKIKKITLNNFRQYKGLQPPIEFSLDDDKNVTVILGINTSGKTTFIQAFNWCLYNETNFPTKDLINIETKKEMGYKSQAEVSVEIELFHEEKIYIIKRSLIIEKTDTDFYKTVRNVLKVEYKEKNGEMKEVRDIESQNTINKILPPDLSDYFFFDGEHIAAIDKKKDVQGAIKGLMGLDVIAQIIKHLNPDSNVSVISKLKRELDLTSEKDGERYKKELENVKFKVNELDAQIDNYEKDITYFQDTKKNLEDKIRDNQDTKKQQDKINSLERQITDLIGQVDGCKKDIIHKFSKKGFEFFAIPQYKKVQKILQDAKESKEGIPYMHSKAIDYVLKRNKCICGCDLTNNENARKSIAYEQSLLPPKSLGTIINTYRRDTIQHESNSEDYFMQIDSAFKNLRQLERFLQERIEEKEEISKNLLNNVNVGEYERELRETEKVLKETIRNRENALVRKGEYKNRISNLEKDIDKLVASNDKNCKVSKNIAYAEKLYDVFNSEYTLKENKVKEDLYASINNTFKEMYHGKRKLEIDAGYNIILKTETKDGTFVTDTSPGLDTVKNFAFITGLVDLAKQRANNTNEDSLEEIEPYPVVMDAPFSNADEIHIKNISEVIPKVAEQVILIVMKKDWEFAQESLENRLGILYEIEKQAETVSYIRRIK